MESIISGAKNVLINLDEVSEWDTQISSMIINDATKSGIKAFEYTLKETVNDVNPSIDVSGIEVGFYGECIPFTKVHDISSKHIGKMIRIRGLVNRTHFIKPMAVRVVFKCRECGMPTTPKIQESPFVLTLPFGKSECCNNPRAKYDVVPELSEYIDSQEFSIQEAYEDVSGRIPQRIRLIIFKSYLINKVYCGDSVEITGIVKLIPEYRKSSRSRFNVPFIEVLTLKRKSKDPESMEITKEEEEKILALATKPEIYSILIKNVAPSLYGMEECKESCLLSLFGGVDKQKIDIKIRGNIHILLVGDPATGKSKLLKAIAELSPRGMFSSGRGTTAAGLTASMNKDTNGEWCIDAGVLVLADKGVACIDEIDKMRKEDRVNIHEAMAQQTVTIDKAGVHSTLMARTSVIAAANSTLGRYDRTKSVFENLTSFPPALFSRFDLIFTLIDRPETSFDRKVVEHIVNGDEAEETLNRDLFKKYIAFAKRINPTISNEAKSTLMKHFLFTRDQMAKNWSEETTPITFRQFEALMRLCEAHARALLKQTADEEDANAVIILFNKFLRNINFDIATLETGKSKSLKDIIEAVRKIVSELQTIEGVAYSQIVEEARARGLPRLKVTRAIQDLINSSSIYMVGNDGKASYYRTTSAC